MEHAIQEANRKLGLLNSITRHDIINQLTMIQGFTQVAAAKEQDPVIGNYLGKINAGSATIHRQIDFMKTYQELGVGSPAWFRLDATVGRAAPDIVCSETCRDIEVFADPMLEKVFFNLSDNATRHGGHVTRITVGCIKAQDTLVIVVEDDGTGIPDNEKEQIFEKGFGKHSGFGLFLAREILSITGITIRENGVPGNGARFEIIVPKGKFRIAGE
jgi:signal transduction histidine kinase